MSEKREAAAASLIDRLREAYPEKGFTIHPSLSFKAADGGRGMGAFATDPINAGEILLVIPESARFAKENIPQDEKSSRLARLLTLIAEKCRKFQNSLGAELAYGGDPEEFAIAVMVMWAVCRTASQVDQPSDSLWSAHVATWPSEHDLRRSMPVYWDQSCIGILGKSSLRESLEQRQELIRRIFDGVIYPTLSSISSEEGLNYDYILPVVKDRDLASMKEALWESFRYAFTVVYSRAHGTRSAPEILPLVEIINGADEEGNTNVSIASGMWPFVRGSMFVDECNLPCSAVHATRDIDRGEELIISYGELMPSEFLGKYGTIPRDLVARHDMVDRVDIFCPPDLVPSESMRSKALRKQGFPLEDLKSGKRPLAALEKGSLVTYQGGGEDHLVASVRQFLILGHLANDAEVQLNISTGRLRCVCLNSSQIGALLLRVIDHNLDLLNSSGNTSSMDIVESNNSDDPSRAAVLLGRVCQRETLTLWRHLFCRRFDCASHSDTLGNTMSSVTSVDLPACLSGAVCRVCGRTYPIRTCSRCKDAKYCTREHQKIDWKAHKPNCISPI